MAVLYLSAFWLIQANWPLTMAAAKLVTGWMACTILAIARYGSHTTPPSETAWPQGHLFRIFIIGINAMVTIIFSTRISVWLAISIPVALGGLYAIGLGVLYMGITARAFRVIIALLTILIGFEIIYSAVERSILVTAMLSVINLGLALIGGYFLTIEESEVAL